MVIASSGNGAQANEMGSPACLSNVIAVAATNDTDAPFVLNNRNSELDFFAPCVVVSTSSLPVNTMSSSSETSVSAAHLSAAWAVMKSKEPTASLTKIENAFINTGVPITQGLFTKPRINLTAALGQLTAVVQLPIPLPSNRLEFLPAIYFILND